VTSIRPPRATDGGARCVVDRRGVAARLDAREARRAAVAARRAAFIRDVVDAAPPLTVEQRDRLARLLAPVVPEVAERERRNSTGSP